MKLMGIYLGLSVFCASLAWAIPYPYQADIADEIQNADFLTVSAEQKAQWVKLLLTGTLTEKEVRKIVGQATHVSEAKSLEQAKRFSVSVPKTLKNDPETYLTIFGEELGLNSRHAITDLSSYIKNRIGPNLFDHLQKKKQKMLIVGSEPSAIQEDLKIILPKGDYEVSMIPSIYEKWGLHRYWVQAKTSPENFFVLSVPPSAQYVRHYVSILDSASLHSSAKGFLSVKSQNQLKANLKKIALEVRKNFGDLSVLFFGYEKNLIEKLKKDNSAFEMMYSTSVKTDLGLNLYLMQIKNKKSGKVIRVGSLQPQQTVWGELASFYFEAMLGLSPKIVLFMGSAGALNPQMKPYQLSIPDEFTSASGVMNIRNWILTQTQIKPSADVHTTARHGNTYSPIQQDRTYVRNLLKIDIETVDVEQALVARMISEVNIKKKSDIQFGAINVITDQPGGVMLPVAGHRHDLDKTDFEAKTRAKDRAAEIAISAIEKLTAETPVESPPATGSCKILFK